MSIQAFVPTLQDTDLYQLFRSILTRALDCTRKPLFVDEVNQRIILGGTVSGGVGSPVQVQSGNIEVTTAGKGVVIKDSGGSGKSCLMTLTYDSATGNWVPSYETIA